MDTMKKAALFAMFVMGPLLAGLTFAQAQQTQPVPSLGDLARRVRAERSKGNAQPAKVYTNDNLPRQGGLISESAASEGEQPKPQSQTSGTGEAGPAKSAGAKSAVHDEQYYRETMKEIESQKEMHQRELAVLEQKLSLNETQYYADPNKTLLQEFTRSDIEKKQDDINKKKQQIADDEKAISDLQAQCQREGCSPGWLR